MNACESLTSERSCNSTLYSFESEAHESLCLLAFGQEWKVFLSERGQRHEEQTFSNEDEACVYFLKRIFQLAR